MRQPQKKGNSISMKRFRQSIIDSIIVSFAQGIPDISKTILFFFLQEALLSWWPI
jgi:hypothetical protein